MTTSQSSTTATSIRPSPRSGAPGRRPGDQHHTVALFIEAGLIALGISMLSAMSKSAGGGLRGLTGR